MTDLWEAVARPLAKVASGSVQRLIEQYLSAIPSADAALLRARMPTVIEGATGGPSFAWFSPEEWTINFTDGGPIGFDLICHEMTHVLDWAAGRISGTDAYARGLVPRGFGKEWSVPRAYKNVHSVAAEVFVDAYMAAHFSGKQGMQFERLRESDPQRYVGLMEIARNVAGAASVLRSTAAKTYRFYHGTTTRALEAIRSAGEIRTLKPSQIAADIERQYHLPSGSVLNEPSFYFSRDREDDPHIYLAGDYETAASYAQGGGEVMSDALNSAWSLLNPSEDPRGRELDDPIAMQRSPWIVEQMRTMHGTPVVLTIDLPADFLWEHINDYQRQHFGTQAKMVEMMEQYGPGTATWLIKAPIPASYITMTKAASLKNVAAATLTLYHGTLYWAAQDIDREGIRPNDLGMVYATTDIERAEMWARRRAEQNPGESPMVVVFEADEDHVTVAARDGEVAYWGTVPASAIIDIFEVDPDGPQ